MEPLFEENIDWNPEDDGISPGASASPSREEDRRHSSSASSSTLAASDNSSDSSGSRGRRSRPSVASASSQLPTLREKREPSTATTQSGMSGSLLKLESEETVLSSQKVGLVLFHSPLSSLGHPLITRLLRS